MKIALLPTRWRLPSVGAGVVPGPFKGVEECDSSLCPKGVSLPCSSLLVSQWTFKVVLTQSRYSTPHNVYDVGGWSGAISILH